MKGELKGLPFLFLKDFLAKVGLVTNRKDLLVKTLRGRKA